MKFGTGKCNQQCKGSELCVSFFFCLFLFLNLRSLAGLEDWPLNIGMLELYSAFPKV